MCHGHIDPKYLMREAEARLPAASPSVAGPSRLGALLAFIRERIRLARGRGEAVAPAE